jgi:putative ABC transport system permease protein
LPFDFLFFFRWHTHCFSSEHKETNAGGNRMTQFGMDLRYGIRTLAKSPGFALIAILTLGLGIGANTAIFSVVNGVLLNPLPYRDPDRLVSLRSNESVPDLADIKAWTQSYEDLGGTTFAPLDFTGGSEPEQWLTGLVTGGYFNTLGIAPMIGRAISPEDDKIGGARVIVLSHGLWQRLFDGDANVIGRSLPLSGERYTILGVMPPGFRSPREETIAWCPVSVASPEAAAYRGVHFLRTYLRLKPGVALPQAMAEIGAIDKRLAEAYPQENSKRQSRLMPLRDRLIGDSRQPLLILFGAVGLVLLIACANYANLLLARAVSRQQELAVRAALGASRWRLIRSLVTESLIVGILGGALGLMLAQWGVDLLLSLRPENYVRMDGVALDGRVLLFTLAISIGTGLLFGLLPAWRSASVDPGKYLKEGSRASAGMTRTAMRSALVVIEMALALVLLIGAGLLLRSFWRIYTVDPGFNPKNLLTLRIDLPEARYKELPKQAQFRNLLLDELNAVPGAQAAMISELPLGGDSLNHDFQVEGQPVTPGQEPDVETRSIEGAYFRVMQIPLLAGRDFAAQDTEKTQLVGIINQSLKNQFFPNEDPIGKRVRWARDEQPNWITIVGVAADVRQFTLDSRDEPALYTPYAQVNRPWKRWMSVVVRDGGAGIGAEAIKSRVWKLDPQLPVRKIRSMTAVMAENRGERRFHLFLLCSFAGLAILLTMVGIYGVMSYIVSQRTHEIGLRMALGAQRTDLLRLVVGRGMKLAGLGVALGLLGSLALTRVMAGLLYDVQPTDPLTFVSVALLLLLIALLACYLPARRATRIDPLEALRCD